MVANVLLCIGYDGTDFCGYQKQLNNRTVQGDIEVALSHIFQHTITTHSSGRTDSGVHAVRQFVNFQVTACHIPFENIAGALNKKLHHDIRVFWSREISRDFHARYSATARKYYYQIYEGYVVPPTICRYAYGVPHKMNWKNIQEECNALLGEHDFSAFASYNVAITNHVRNITRIQVVRHDPIIRIYVEGNAFLWKMVRTIVGTLIERELDRLRNKRIEMSISDILKSKNRNFAGTTAPSHALFLYDVIYEDKYGITKE